MNSFSWVVLGFTQFFVLFRVNEIDFGSDVRGDDLAKDGEGAVDQQRRVFGLQEFAAEELAEADAAALFQRFAEARLVDAPLLGVHHGERHLEHRFECGHPSISLMTSCIIFK